MNLIKRALSGIVAFAILASTPAYASTTVFSDVSSTDPHYQAIIALQEKGVIGGYPDHTFRPDQSVNRAEILKIILLGSDILVPEIQPQAIFPDVDSQAWYGKFVAKAKNLGIVKGDDQTGLFRPGDSVNLAEALKILLKTNSIEVPAPSYSPYADVPSSAWFSPFFDYAQKAGLLDQKPEEMVAPSLAVTRGLLAELMYRQMNTTYIQPDGRASYYGAEFHGKTTANGEVFDASAMTAAHRTYPFNTWLLVTNTENGQSVAVRVNDRGPYVTDPTRIIDLSKAAFEAIAPLSRGIIPVTIEVTTAPETTTNGTDGVQPEPTVPTTTPTLTGDLLNATKLSCPEASTGGIIDPKTYEGITLTKAIPTRVLQNEVLNLQGSVLTTTPRVSAFLVDSDNNQTSFSADVSNKQFTLYIRFPKAGTFKLGILPGESGTSIVKDIIALKNTCIEEVESQNLLPVSNIKLAVENGDTKISWGAGTYNLFRLTVMQGGLKKTYLLHDATPWKPFYRDFADFKAGPVDLYLRGSRLDRPSVLDPLQIIWSPATKTSFTATVHHEYTVNSKEVDLVSLTPTSIVQETILALFKPKVPVRSSASVILPNGTVKELAISSATLTPEKNAFGIEVFPATTEILTAKYIPLETSLHILEVNNAEGLAVINVPIYARNQYPLIPNPRDLKESTPVDLGTDLPALRATWLKLVNADRAAFKLPALVLDDNATKLAQFRSDDMVKYNYFGHWDSQGLSANDLRKNYGIQTLVGENLAKDITLELAEYGLMQSAIHRTNILSPEWTRVGLGITKASDGGYDFVQIFTGNPLDLSNIDALRNELLSAINAGRSLPLALTSNLNTLAQTWSQKMVDQNFFNFTDPSGASLVDSIRAAGIQSALGTYIMGNSAFADAVKAASENVALRETNWKKIGIGIQQDKEGIIKTTLIYTE